MQRLNEKFKPCPFCGREATLWHNLGKGFKTAKCICKYCNSTGKTISIGTRISACGEEYIRRITALTEEMKAEAIREWNRREE